MTESNAKTPDGVNSAIGGAGEGSAYPNPHTGKTERGEGGKLSHFMSHGGQSEIAYHGPGQLGDDRDTPGDNLNAATRTE